MSSPIDSHADDDVDTAGHEGVDERHHEMSLSDDGDQQSGLSLNTPREADCPTFIA